MTETVAREWLAGLSEALEQRDLDAIDDLFLPDGWWRDLLALTWDLRTLRGTDRIRGMLEEHLDAASPSGFTLTEGKPVALVEPAEDVRWIEAFFDFETAVGRGRGVVRLMPDGGGWRAWTLLTALQELKGHEEHAGPRRPWGVEHGEQAGREIWLDRRRREQSFEDREPRVLVVGAGQGGLTVAARLRQLGVDTLVVERNRRVGDNWRRRYRSLVLHDPVWYDHLPYLAFPPTWPVFTPKDKLAEWFESYAAAMELDVWTETELVGAFYDDAAGTWDVRVRRPGGEERALRPAHVVLATGASGEPRVPEIPGLEDFRGTVSHSSGHPGGEAFAGRRAVVVGACNSGHDIAHDFHEQGADVTMVQRSSTYVMSSEHGIPLVFAGLYEEGGPPTEDADLLFAAFPFPLLGELNKQTTQAIAELDRELLEGLSEAGFAIDFGEDGSGLLTKYLTRGGGYYIDVGCSRLIAEGKVKVKQGVAIERFTETGLAFADGTSLEADVVVLATGYEDMRETARRLLGDEVADRCTPVWGLDEEGELRTIWRDSGHPGLWFMGGNLHLCRFFSRYLALRLKALETGLLPEASTARAV
ncbi:flavin-containing monooxygenase [Capillimicrobium parvum]|uniref:Ferredoxin--NADP reductase n=1 Tax=Capillimicrobium parvum TaxID=2884022 RepID=A0A9E7C128_9ACTN|nr:NAD(P)/FAD-dependent oxidoreductase [Capillimicrobium parvum]UGS36991.1 Ferredoxin--NADP reductase [Capillimicrobium parvum]